MAGPFNGPSSWAEEHDEGMIGDHEIEAMALPNFGLALLLLSTSAAQAQPWKNCSYNDTPIPCHDSHSADGTVHILWKDGLAMTYRVVKEGFPISTLRDRLGGLWEREILPQGHAVFTNRANGNRIVVPSR